MFLLFEMDALTLYFLFSYSDGQSLSTLKSIHFVKFKYCRDKEIYKNKTGDKVMYEHLRFISKCHMVDFTNQHVNHIFFTQKHSSVV